jgi:hypothetical protein
VAVTIALIAWALAPANLALHKPATSSSSGFDTTPSGATDGDKFTRFGFHSAEEDSPWLSIDLQRPYEISAVKIYGRGDCCFDQSVPLALEVSDDGTTYRQIAERTQSFSQSDPWIVRPDRTLARFVRLHVMRRSYLVVSEVVVNGRSPK